MEQENVVNVAIVKKNSGLGVASFVCGLIAFIFGICLAPLGLVLSIIAVILGIISINKSKSGLGIAGTVLGSIALITSIAVLVLAAGATSTIFKEVDERSKIAVENKEAGKEQVKEVKIPIVVTVDEIMEALNNNALKASATYKNQYVELTGKLSNIDSSGSYFSIGILSDEFSFDTVLCNINEEHLETVMNFNNEQEVTVIGTITVVGEIMGYTLEVESIK
ncbi:MAG: hypothetical protein CVV02_05810 [Firmicutes bacterium HGW-Firmicutes-7]|nr:MAG: hypothetical protein CVV02_05810 [Firmicutes bacterium HGW-Firmicutes-7]